MKIFACYCRNGLVICAARSKEEAYGAMVMSDDSLKYKYKADDFYEIKGTSYDGDYPCMLAEGSGE